jgi:hypothetical protein
MMCNVADSPIYRHWNGTSVLLLHFIVVTTVEEGVEYEAVRIVKPWYLH